MRFRWLTLFLILLIALSLLGVSVLYAYTRFSEQTEVVFLNIGQGDAILLSQGSNQILIDSGKDGKELLSRLSRHIPFWDRHIELVIATHPDADHIGGFSQLFRAYTVEKVLTSGVKSETEVSELFETLANEENSSSRGKIFRGSHVVFPEEGKLTVVYPELPLEGVVKDTNAKSIVTRFEYGKTSFLFTGDLAKEEEVLSGEKLVTVLKAAHHGSKYSTSEAFLRQVQPQEVVISVGENNYGHPHPEVLERLKEAGALVRRTDTDGDIRYVCTRSLSGCLFTP